MAEFIREVDGEAISGPEKINPGHVSIPEDHTDYAVDIPFTHIQRDVNLERKTQIQNNRCLFSSIEKKYDEDGNCQAKRANFSWWSVYLDYNARGIVMQNRQNGWEIESFFEGKSRFGDHRLILPLDRMMEVYWVNSGIVPVMRILGTFKYTREWMHAFVITPSEDMTFHNHPVAATIINGTLAWDPSLPLQANNGTYEWNAFSTVTWDNNNRYGKDRKWNHLSFAFHLDPLPGTVLQLQPEDVMDEKWEAVPP